VPALHGRGTLGARRDPRGPPASLALVGSRLLSHGETLYGLCAAVSHPRHHAAETEGDVTVRDKADAVTITRAGRWLISLAQRSRSGRSLRTGRLEPQVVKGEYGAGLWGYTSALPAGRM
jgi:hypothetical protein